MQVYYCSSRWPGSVHDARVMRNSSLATAFDRHLPFHKAILLGDSGYALSPWLITPISVPVTPAENLFNMHHKRMRRVIECCFGVLKQRFRCLQYLHLEPAFAGEVVKACCVLHTIMIDHRRDEYDVADIQIVEDLALFPVPRGAEVRRERRNELIQHFENFDE